MEISLWRKVGYLGLAHEFEREESARAQEAQHKSVIQIHPDKKALLRVCL
jgi:hypothetical protein